MTKRVYIAYWILLIALCCAIFLLILFTTQSVVYSIFSTALCIVLHFVVKIFISNYQGRHLKKLLLSIGQDTSPKDIDFDDEAQALHDFVRFNGRSFPVGIKVGKRGIYILCAGLFSVTIPWDQVTNISMFKWGSKVKAKLTLSNASETHAELVIGWDESFESFVPKSTAYNVR